MTTERPITGVERQLQINYERTFLAFRGDNLTWKELDERDLVQAQLIELRAYKQSQQSVKS